MTSPNDDQKWQPISEDEMHALLEEELMRCTPEDRALFQQIQISLRSVPFARGGLTEDVFAVAQSGDKLVFYDDVEDAFEVASPDIDGVIRFGCGQFELRHALAQLRIGSR